MVSNIFLLRDSENDLYPILNLTRRCGSVYLGVIVFNRHIGMYISWESARIPVQGLMIGSAEIVLHVVDCWLTFVK